MTTVDPWKSRRLLNPVRACICLLGMPASHSHSYLFAGPRSAVDSASDSGARGSGFDTRSGHILSFHIPLIHLSVTGESMCTKYWLTAQEAQPSQEKCCWVNRHDHHYRERKPTSQQQQNLPAQQNIRITYKLN